MDKRGKETKAKTQEKDQEEQAEVSRQTITRKETEKAKKGKADNPTKGDDQPGNKGKDGKKGDKGQKATYKDSDAPSGQTICMKLMVGKCPGPPDNDCKFWHPPLDGKRGFCYFFQLEKSHPKSCTEKDCPYQHTALGNEAANALRIRITKSRSPTGRGKGSGQ